MIRVMELRQAYFPLGCCVRDINTQWIGSEMALFCERCAGSCEILCLLLLAEYCCFM